jgi:hypothetical protein
MLGFLSTFDLASSRTHGSRDTDHETLARPRPRKETGVECPQVFGPCR